LIGNLYTKSGHLNLLCNKKSGGSTLPPPDVKFSAEG